MITFLLYNDQAWVCGIRVNLQLEERYYEEFDSDVARHYKAGS